MTNTNIYAKQLAHQQTLDILAEHFKFHDTQLQYEQWSADLPYGKQTIQMLDIKEQLVARIRETEEPGFEMLITPSQIKHVERTSVGSLFYNLIMANPFQPISSHYEVGEGAKLFDTLAETLELKSGRLTGEATSRTWPQGPSEAEFVNGLIAQIRKASKKPTFQKKCSARTSQSKKVCGQMCRLINQLEKEFPSLCGQWITLEYKPSSQFVKQVSLPESVTNFERFRDGLQEIDLSTPSIGQIWMRQYTRETGYRTRLLLLYPQRQPEWSTNIAREKQAQLWGSITQERGKIITCQQIDHQPSLLEFIRQQMLGENILRLKLDPKHPNFGCIDSRDFAPQAKRTIGLQPLGAHQRRSV